jgi:hypothetical protein
MQHTESSNSVVFSFWTAMLDIVELVLRENGFRIQRIDGQTELPKRRRVFELFRADDSCTVLLASIGSIGEGYVILPQCPCCVRAYVRIAKSGSHSCPQCPHT